MNSEQCAELSRRLKVMDCGEAPGSGPVEPDLAVDSVLPSSPSIVEMEAALQSDVASMSNEDCLRALVMQNNVLIRDAIWRRRHFAIADSSSYTGQSGSLRSSLTTTGTSSGRVSSGDSGGVSPIRKRRSPPKVFVCPVCQKHLNEKDFDRHISSWIAKCRTGANVVKAGHCAGIRDLSHPLLDHFDGESLDERVTQLVLDVRSLMHPGAYDAMSAQGSGRHVDVAKRFAQYLNQQ